MNITKYIKKTRKKRKQLRRQIKVSKRKKSKRKKNKRNNYKKNNYKRNNYKKKSVKQYKKKVKRKSKKRKESNALVVYRGGDLDLKKVFKTIGRVIVLPVILTLDFLNCGAIHAVTSSWWAWTSSAGFAAAYSFIACGIQTCAQLGFLVQHLYNTGSYPSVSAMYLKSTRTALSSSPAGVLGTKAGSQTLQNMTKNARQSYKEVEEWKKEQDGYDGYDGYNGYDGYDGYDGYNGEGGQRIQRGGNYDKFSNEIVKIFITNCGNLTETYNEYNYWEKDGQCKKKAKKRLECAKGKVVRDECKPENLKTFNRPPEEPHSCQKAAALHPKITKESGGICVNIYDQQTKQILQNYLQSLTLEEGDINQKGLEAILFYMAAKKIKLQMKTVYYAEHLGKKNYENSKLSGSDKSEVNQLIKMMIDHTNKTSNSLFEKIKKLNNQTNQTNLIEVEMREIDSQKKLVQYLQSCTNSEFNMEEANKQSAQNIQILFDKIVPLFKTKLNEQLEEKLSFRIGKYDEEKQKENAAIMT